MSDALTNSLGPLKVVRRQKGAYVTERNAMRSLEQAAVMQGSCECIRRRAHRNFSGHGEAMRDKSHCIDRNLNTLSSSCEIGIRRVRVFKVGFGDTGKRMWCAIKN